MKMIFDKEETQKVIDRINLLSPNSERIWGTMSVDQMLAHCNVAYTMVYDDTITKHGAFKKWLLKTFVKKVVVGDKPYKRSAQTAPEFMIEGTRDFQVEKEKLCANLLKTQQLGADYFDNKESHSFGKLTSQEWHYLFYKHLDHHLKQFAV